MSGEHPLREEASRLPRLPGVYRFVDGEGRVLYVGKAKALRDRVWSYFRDGVTPKIARMLGMAEGLQVAVTVSENQALLLEANLIKALRPRFNVLLKDDKSYPYLRLSGEHPYPRLMVYRGSREEEGGVYFGPYPSVQALRTAMHWMQRLFPLRQCDARKFAQRRRPCLQYQIKRCGAPCCGLVTPEEYGEWIKELLLFLAGKGHELIVRLRRSMEAAAEVRDYEGAARWRDRMQALVEVQKQHSLDLVSSSGGGGGDLDVAAVVREGGRTAVQVFTVRSGINLGNRSYWPEQTEEVGEGEILAAFLAQFYADRSPPPEVVVSHEVADSGWLAAALGERRGGKVRVWRPQRGGRRRLWELAMTNAAVALQTVPVAGQEGWEDLAAALRLAVSPSRIEIYDVSHFQGAAPVGAMVVADASGFCRREYRRYRLDDPGLTDDTARMGAMVGRRFRRLRAQRPEERPGMILLDGGIGQLQAAMAAAAAELQGEEGPVFCAMAKGEERRAGSERLFLPHLAEPIILPPRSPAGFLLQRLRDEAHRCAVGFHRQRRDGERSILDRIDGVGVKRKRLLLQRFGSVRAIREAEVGVLAAESGISRALAERIHRFFRESE